MELFSRRRWTTGLAQQSNMQPSSPSPKKHLTTTYYFTETAHWSHWSYNEWVIYTHPANLSGSNMLATNHASGPTKGRIHSECQSLPNSWINPHTQKYFCMNASHRNFSQQWFLHFFLRMSKTIKFTKIHIFQKNVFANISKVPLFEKLNRI